MAEQLDQYIGMKGLTHKQLATIVIHMTGNSFTNDENMRNWARYYALMMRPWQPLPAVKKERSRES